MDPDDRGYHAEHTWAKTEGDHVRVGITDYAQEELSTVVYVDLPEPGTHVENAVAFGEIESTKTVNDLVAPLGGTVSARNDALADDPELVNRDPYGDGWLIVLAPDDLGEIEGLLTPEQYQERTQAQWPNPFQQDQHGGRTLGRRLLWVLATATFLIFFQAFMVA